MCGIVFTLQSADATDDDGADFDALVRGVAPRGPDYRQTVSITVGSFKLRFHAAVLHLRGDHVAKQPFRTDQYILIYNGEIFDGLSIKPEENDGEALFAALNASSDVLPVFKHIEGPYAIVYLDIQRQRLYYARDPLGRRSLMVRYTSNGLQLASVLPAGFARDGWQELNTDSLVEVDLSTAVWRIEAFSEPNTYVKRHKRVLRSEDDGEHQIYPFDRINRKFPTARERVNPLPNNALPHVDFEKAIEALYAQLQDAVRKRVADIPRLQGPAYPEARVAILFSGGLDCSVLACMTDEFLPQGEAIDLLNVAFENPRSLSNKPECANHATSIYDTPDRLTGISTYEELCRTRPDRQWNFVQVDVPYSIFSERRADIIASMWPNNTAMDLSIAQALYFAAAGQGSLHLNGERTAYASRARVLLSGLGADEQLGGYSRHKKAFGSSENWSALIRELQMDLDRIGSRNLGRDDRVIASIGKEVRYPYLAGHVIEFLASLPVHLKMDYQHGDGVGDKMLLRSIAKRLGLSSAASFPKRAIQFGARSAKMEVNSHKTKGDVIVQ